MAFEQKPSRFHHIEFRSKTIQIPRLQKKKTTRENQHKSHPHRSTQISPNLTKTQHHPSITNKIQKKKKKPKANSRIREIGSNYHHNRSEDASRSQKEPAAPAGIVGRCTSSTHRTPSEEGDAEIKELGFRFLRMRSKPRKNRTWAVAGVAKILRVFGVEKRQKTKARKTKKLARVGVIYCELLCVDGTCDES